MLLHMNWASLSNGNCILAHLCAAATRLAMVDISSAVVPEFGYKQPKREQVQHFLCGQARSAYNLSAISLDDSLVDDGTPACKKRKRECSRNCSIQLSHLSSACDTVIQHSAKNLLQWKSCYPHQQRPIAAYRNTAGIIHAWILKTISITVMKTITIKNNNQANNKLLCLSLLQVCRVHIVSESSRVLAWPCKLIPEI